MQCSMNTAVGREDGAQVEGCAHTRVLRRRRPRERAPAPRRTPPRENTARCAQRPSDSNIPRAKAYPVTAPPLYRCTPRSPTSRHSSKERRCLRVKVRTNNRRAPQRFVTTDVPRCQRTPAERLRALRARGMQQRKRCARVQACADSKKSRGVWLSQWLLDGYSGCVYEHRAKNRLRGLTRPYAALRARMHTICTRCFYTRSAYL